MYSSTTTNNKGASEKHKKKAHLWNRASPTYSFPALCCAFTSLVARSMHTMRHPVTLGSRVPLWPVFSTRRMRLIHATTLPWRQEFQITQKD